MSGVPAPRVRNPKPRSRLNHFTCARSSPLVGATVTARLLIYGLLCKRSPSSGPSRTLHIQKDAKSPRIPLGEMRPHEVHKIVAPRSVGDTHTRRVCKRRCDPMTLLGSS